MAWSRKHSKCIECHSTNRKHYAHGLCSSCYLKKWRSVPENARAQKEYKKKWHKENVFRTGKDKEQRDKWSFDGNREKALRRDNYTCQICGTKEASLCVHHKDETGRNHKGEHNNDMDNLISLCRSCHATIHHTIDFWAKEYSCCVECGSTEYRHAARGLCLLCYSKKRYLEKKARYSPTSQATVRGWQKTND